jgi:uncharacterized membrane protein
MADVASMTRKGLQVASKVKPGKSKSSITDKLPDPGQLKGPQGLAVAGAALAALPLAAQGISKLTGKGSDMGEKLKDTAKLFGGGDDDGDDDEGGAGQGSAAPGTGNGRRMPIQQAVDVAVPVEVAYDQWTRFEEWPEFMHRLESAEQIDDTTVAFSAKIWGINRRFEAEILEQVPRQRIEWDVSEGIAHSGVVTFHELSDRLTRIDVTLDIEPHGLIEKAARGMRIVKRAVRADLHRFKAYVELNDEAEKGWRGRIEDGKVKRRPSSQSRNGSSASKSKSSSRS